jgi:hypothetical protein
MGMQMFCSLGGKYTKGKSNENKQVHTMKLKGQLQWTDYFNSQLLHTRALGAANETQGIIYPFTLFFLFLFGCFYFATRSIGFTSKYVLSMLVLSVFVYMIQRWVLLPKQVRRMFAQQKELGSSFEIEFSETGMTFSNEYGYHMKPWETFVTWKEDGEFMLLYHADNLYTIVPKRIFADPQQIDIVKSYLKTKIKVEKSNSGGLFIYLLLFAMTVLWVWYYMR